MLQRIINMSFYAVRSGRMPGIYKDWEACRAQVNGFSGARYKKFKSMAEAQTFIDEKAANSTKPIEEEGAAIESVFAASKLPYAALPLGPASKKRRRSSEQKLEPPAKLAKRMRKARNSSEVGDIPETPDVSRRKPIDVYTDGACTHNGRSNAKAAIGVFWGVDSPMNVSERLAGRQTNNRAEIHAARRAIDQAKSMGRTNIRLFTDSQFLINSMTKWVRNWQKNGWKLINGHPVINKEDFEQIMASAESMNITWIKVAAHQGVFGNEWADKLAVAGLREDLPAEDP